MMTEDIYEAVCKDDAERLYELMGVDAGGGKGTGRSVGVVGTAVSLRSFHPEDWEGHQIWPRRSRRMTILQLAVREGSLSVVKMLVAAGLSLNYGEAGTALVTALEYEQLESLQLLINLGSDVNKRLTSGYGPGGHLWWNYPIAIAVRCSSPKPLEILLHNGADPLVQFPLPDTPHLITKPLMVTSFTPALRRARYDCRFLALLLKAIPCLDGAWTCWNPIPDSVWFELQQIFHSSVSPSVEQTDLGISIALLMMDLGFKIPVYPQDIIGFPEIKQYACTPQSLKQICRLNIRKNYRLFDRSSHLQSQQLCQGEHSLINGSIVHRHKEDSTLQVDHEKKDSLSSHPVNIKIYLSESSKNTQPLSENSDFQTDQPTLGLSASPNEPLGSCERCPMEQDHSCPVKNDTKDKFVNDTKCISEPNSMRNTVNMDAEADGSHSGKLWSPLACAPEDVQIMETDHRSACQSVGHGTRNDNPSVLIQTQDGTCRTDFEEKDQVFPTVVDLKSDSTVTSSLPVLESQSLNSLDKLHSGNEETPSQEKSNSETKLPLLQLDNILMDNVLQERSQSLPPDVSCETDDSNEALAKSHIERSLSSPVECGLALDEKNKKTTRKGVLVKRGMEGTDSRWSNREKCSFWQVLDTLPLPKALISFLKFQEL